MDFELTKYKIFLGKGAAPPCNPHQGASHRGHIIFLISIKYQHVHWPFSFRDQVIWCIVTLFFFFFFLREREVEKRKCIPLHLFCPVFNSTMASYPILIWYLGAFRINPLTFGYDFHQFSMIIWPDRVKKKKGIKLAHLTVFEYPNLWASGGSAP